MGPNLPLHLPCITGSRTFFLGFLPLALFRLRNIKSCFVITPLILPFPIFLELPPPPFSLLSPVPLVSLILLGSHCVLQHCYFFFHSVA